jgi:hypothetical protein
MVKKPSISAVSSPITPLLIGKARQSFGDDCKQRTCLAAQHSLKL